MKVKQCDKEASAAGVWRDFHKDPPKIGTKIAIVCDDGCSTGLAYITDEGALDGEDGVPLGAMFLQGAIWTPLPDDFPLAFMVS